MSGFQQTIIIGNVGKEPEFKYLQNGTPVCNFNVAVTEKWGSGEDRQEKTTWYRVACWRKLAEIANQYVRKGGKVQIVGTVKATAFLDKNGKPQGQLELTATNMLLLGGGNGAASDGGEYEGPSDGGDSMGEIPF